MPSAQAMSVTFSNKNNGIQLFTMEYPELEFKLLFVQILTGHVILRYLVRTHFPLLCIPSALDTSDDIGLERIPLLHQLVDAFRIRGFKSGQAL